MAVPADFAYLRYVHGQGALTGPLLEIGARSWQGETGNLQGTCSSLGIEWEGADIVNGPGVNLELDILDCAAVAAISRRWGTVAVFNLLEHVYDPITALKNCLSLVSDGGSCIVAGPAVWQLHRFPLDLWRPLPDFFLEFGRREGCAVPEELMQWLTLDRLISLASLREGSDWLLPSATTSRQVWGAKKALRSRIIHRLFRTYGRGLAFPYVGLGVTLVKQ